MSAVEGGHLPLPIMVALFNERTLRRQCLASLLELNGLRLHLIETAGDGKPERLAPATGTVDVLVIDIGDRTCREPGIRMMVERLRHSLPSVPIVVVSDRDERAAVIDALAMGARAYCPSSLDPEMLVETLRYVQKGGTFVPPSALMTTADPPRLPHSVASHASDPMIRSRLTERERHVLEFLQRGNSNKSIARELQIEEGTVKVHVRRIMKKLHATNRTQAALLGQQIAGLVN